MKNFALWLGAVTLVCGAVATAPAAGDEGRRPDLDGAVTWLNSAPLSSKSLRGKVVLVNFWTYSCINSLRELPYMKAWAAKYKDAGLVVIGVHTPEFSFEANKANVEQAIENVKVIYPVAIDSNHGVWNAFGNNYWPANYFIDGKGRIRYHYFGEGAYVESKRAIQELLRENGATDLDQSTVRLSAEGVEAAPSQEVASPETYVGYGHAERFASPQRVARDSRASYTLPMGASLNRWGLSGLWTVEAERAVLGVASGRVAFRFHSRDLHMVLGPAKDGLPVRFRITLDGAPPDHNHGSDCGPDGAGTIREPRLFQLIRQQGQVGDRTFEIEFLDPGVQAYAFTFG